MCDRPPRPNIGDSVQVTPEMIEAGLRTLWESGAVEYPMEIDRDLVREIFVSMERQRTAFL
jgi:hypothetical protein